MNKILLVSLVHNRKHLVAEAIQSAINQTLSKDKWHHLIIDNASTDGADKVCEVFSKKYNHITFVKMDSNLHQMPSYNWALRWAESNFKDATIMAHLDSDDKLAESALIEVYNTFNAHPEIGQTYSDFNIIDGKGNLKIKAHPKAKLVQNQYTPEGQTVLRKMFVKSNPIGHLRAISINCLNVVGGFDESKRFATDFNMAGKILEKFPIVKIPKVLYHWRQHNDQVERHHSPEQTQNWLDLQKYYATTWKEKGLI